MFKEYLNERREPSNQREQTHLEQFNGLGRISMLTRSILLVDDEPQTRDLLRLMLKRDGYDVYEAEDGYDALDKVKKIIPDMVLLDVMMPDIDGITVCERIRADEETAEIPVVMLSARTHLSAVEKGVIAGATRYLTKPIGRPDLLRHVQEVLNGVPSPEVQMIKQQIVARGFSD
ncbi:MAG: response regulator [Chloroflexi bacterium]|nr:response regulator [Chloroflexota bacterium]